VNARHGLLSVISQGITPIRNTDLVPQARAGLTKWLGRAVYATTASFWADWFGVSSSGKPVTVDSVLQLSTAWSCVRLISETISTLPLRLYRRQADGSRVRATDHPLYRVLCQSPNAEMTPARFMLQVIASLCLWGNAFVEKVYLGRKLVALNPLLPQGMTVSRLETGQLEYRYRESGTERVIPETAMMHIRGFGLDGISGMLPISAGRHVFGSAMAADEAAASVFANGLQASGVLSSDQTLTQAQREALRENVERFAGSKNSGKLMVLEAGLKYSGIMMNPEAAQMLQTRSFSVEEICRWFRVPPFKVGHMDKASSWASSSEAQNMAFLTDCLRPILVNVEQELVRCLLGPEEVEGVYPEFAVEGLLRADSAGRAAYYHAALNDGWMSRDEVRHLENLGSILGGDTFTVAVNLVPLDKLGQEVATGDAQARSAMASWLGVDRLEASLNELAAVVRRTQPLQQAA